MSGHSKWANIKRGKAINDAKKSQMFSKLSRAITVAAKNGGDPDKNASLRLAVEKAKSERMPKENIDRAIQKGVGGGMSENYEEVVYEGYGPSGVAFYINALTDNKNRTAAEIRNIFSKAGGSMGGAGSTAYIFMPDPQNPSFEVEIDSEQLAKSVVSLEENLEDNDDVVSVYSNFSIRDDIMEKL